MPNPDNTPQIPKNQSSITDDRTGMVSRDWYRFFLNLLNKANTGGGGGSGTVTSIDVSGGTTGLTTSGGPVTTSGTITINGVLNVANGGTGAYNAGTARSNLSAAKSGANTDITSVALTSGTISTAPSVSSDIVNKLYADSIATGVNFHAACQYATTANLNATYNNGSSGVGATLNGISSGALTIDGYTFTSSDTGTRILVKNQTNANENGIYTLTLPGSSFAGFRITRATDYDTSGSGTNEIDQGDFVLIINGTANANTSWVQQTPLPITVGTTNIVFVQFGSATTVTSFSAGSTGFTPNSASSGTVTLGGTLGIANGGTNATTAIGALTSLGAYSASNPNGYTNNTGTVTSVNATVPSLLSVSGVPITTSGTIALTYSGTPLPIANGGTNATTSIAALTSLGAYPAANPNGYTNNTGTVTSVNVTVPSLLSVSGVPITTSGTVALTYSGTALPIANGGTGSTTLAGASIATYTGTETLTNKRINPRFLSQTSVATLAPDISAYDQYNLTAQAAALSVSAPIGTPVDGNKLIFRILDNGTARAITWNATYTVIGVTLPTTTVANKTTYVGCVYNANNTRWDVIAVTTQA
jgi:hypothetical protein